MESKTGKTQRRGSRAALRKRQPNFEQREVDIMVTEVVANKHILFTNSKDAATNEVKRAVWSNIALNVNKAMNNQRTPEELRKKWLSYKSEGRGFRASKRKHQESADTEEGETSFSKTELRVLECIGEAGTSYQATGSQSQETSVIMDTSPQNMDEVKPVVADDGTLLWNAQETPSESSTNSPTSSNIAAPSASESTVSYNIVPTPTLLSTPPAPLSLSSVNPHQRGGKGKHSLVGGSNSESSLKITEEYYRWKMLDYQRQRLEVERERLAVEKERLAIESQRWEYQQFG